MTTTTGEVTGIPLDILFLSIGGLISFIGAIGLLVLASLAKSVTKLRESAAKRDKKVNRLSIAMILVCKKLDIPIPFNGGDSDI